MHSTKLTKSLLPSVDGSHHLIVNIGAHQGHAHTELLEGHHGVELNVSNDLREKNTNLNFEFISKILNLVLQLISGAFEHSVLCIWEIMLWKMWCFTSQSQGRI